MKSILAKTPTALTVALALGAFSATAIAQSRDLNERAIVLDSRGAPVMSANDCVHSGFGPAPQWTAGCHAVVPAPTPVAQQVAPAPRPVQVAAAPILPVYEKVAFDANVLFDSDSSQLRAAGRQTLDAFVGKIGGLEAQSMMAIGYADRMGTDAANQKLSRERVNTVRAYLVSKGVDANRVDTRARGESLPTTYAGECKDANNAKNVACMQPDRHVFIEISGSRLVK